MKKQTIRHTAGAAGIIMLLNGYIILGGVGIGYWLMTKNG